jgi:predicted dehydrogenase
MNTKPQPPTQAALSRRSFLKGALLAGTIIGFPSILASSSRAANGPAGRRIGIGLIGCGRIAQSNAEMLAYEPDVDFVGVCDVDSVRVEKMRAKLTAKVPDKSASLKTFSDYRILLADPRVDAVVICTPDHWHALIAIDAALAGKDVYVEKPCTFTIAEGVVLETVARKQKCIIQVGSQQRSSKQFVRGCEIIRNGGIGKVKRVLVGLPADTAGGRTAKMEIPATLDYDRWLGSAPDLYYTEDRVHPQSGLGRPGWLRGDHFCKGMITGWGTHHVDIAHWALGLEHTGPVKASGKAEFLKNGLWDVPGPFDATLEYADGLVIEISTRFPNGVRFESDDGWLFVSRDAIRPPGDPNGKPILLSLDAHDRALLKAEPGPILLGRKGSHHRNWLDSIVSREAPVAPIDQGHRSNTACLLAYTAMKLDRPVRWDPASQKFQDDPEATQLMSIPERGEYSIPKTLLRHNFSLT